MYHMIIEQTIDYKNRMEYDPINNIFKESEYKSLFYVREFPYPYGWIKESGSPPGQHLDIILLSSKEYNLGDEIPVKIIGCFIRNDGDNKLIGILPQGQERDYEDLSIKQKKLLHKLYPRADHGEGWHGKIKAEEIIETFLKKQKLI